MAYCPEFVCFTYPTIGIRLAFAVQIVDVLRGLHIGGMGTGALYHIPQGFGILQHGTGAEHILIKRLAFLIGHKQRPLVSFQKGMLPDVGVGIMDEGFLKQLMGLLNKN